MTGDWIKMRTDLYRDPKVVLLAENLFSEDSDLARHVNHFCQRDMAVTRNVMRNAVVGALVSVWGVARHQGRRKDDDLVLDNCDLWVLDDIADLPGFGIAMMGVGWCAVQDESLVFPRFFAANNTDPREAQRQKNRDRQQRFREKQRNAPRNARRNVTRNVTVTHREEKSREEDKECLTDTLPAAPREASTTEIQVVVDAWNMIGKPFAMVSRIANRRRAAVKNRLADDWWRERWRDGMERIRGSPFCRGGGEQGWVATFDWFVRPDTLMKVLEGQYDAREAGTRGSGSTHRPSSAEVRERGNVEAIAGFLRRAELRKGHVGADGAEADGGLHGAAIDSVARRVERLQADDHQPGGADDLRK